jgi:dTMP kinase
LRGRDPGLTLITLEGLDKSGKATQTAILAKRLRRSGRDVETIAFPDYTTSIGRIIKRYLDGEVDFGPELRQLLYVANRWEKREEVARWLREEKLVIADRYTPSGLVYGLANGLDLEWMLTLERGLPPSDLVLVIDVSVATAFERATARDVYEANRVFLEKVRQAYRALAKQFGWILVNGENPKGDVAEAIWTQVASIV